jgi:hypothetical protein
MLRLTQVISMSVAFGIMASAPVLAQSCATPLECYERALEAIKSHERSLETERAELRAAMDVLERSLVLSVDECSSLGPSWESWTEADGRYLRVSSDNAEAGIVGGDNTIIIQEPNLPAHTHRYNDIYHAEDPNHERMGQATNRYRGDFQAGIGSEGTDYNNNGGGAQLTRTTVTDTINPAPISIEPEFIVLNICQRKS